MISNPNPLWLDDPERSGYPLNGEGADTVTFALQLSTLGHTGTMATVRVYAVDLLGDRGSAVTRQIRIQ